MTSGNRFADLTTGVVTLLVGSFYLFQALRLPLWSAGGNPGAGFMPTGLGIAMILLSLLLIGRTLRERPDPSGVKGGVAVSKPLYVLFALVAYVFLFPVLGYLLTSVGLVGFLMWTFDPEAHSRRKAVKTSLITILVVGVFYTIFVELLKLQLPPWPFSS